MRKIIIIFWLVYLCTGCSSSKTIMIYDSNLKNEIKECIEKGGVILIDFQKDYFSNETLYKMECK